MCGLTGFWQRSALTSEDSCDMVTRMAAQIAHRGPDDVGAWVDADAGIALGFRRLSIVDLSAAGHQPMASASGRYVIAYNGEIYNHLDLRADLAKQSAAPAWRGHSDTETLLAGFEAWGIEQTVRRAIGMFAIAVWDRSSRSLTLGRDRLGEKPLYYGWQGNVFLFGSELKALRAHPAFAAEVNRDSLACMLRYSYVPAPRSIYAGISKLMPGTLAELRPGTRDLEVTTYWSAAAAIRQARSKPFAGSPAEAVESLERLLMDAIGRQMMADVPLGAFLSGGIDSSAIVALMQSQSTRPVQTFSIGFDEASLNEAPHAKAVAAHLGTAHTELYVAPRDALDVIPRLPSMYDEPFSDSSQIPTYLVSAMARKHVTVSLSGDAGDELFCGYNRYMFGDRIWRKISRAPLGLRRGAARLLSSVPPQTWDRLHQRLRGLMPVQHRFAQTGDKIHKAAQLLYSRSPSDVYQSLVSHWEDPGAVVVGSSTGVTTLPDLGLADLGLGNVERMMAIDLSTYLPDDILCKVDRAAMACSLETRVPFLDHRVVEFAWRLPFDYKQRDGVGKWVLRQVLNRHVPQALTERPKMGFGVPIDHWLRGPLRDWAEALLSPARLQSDGFFVAEPILRKWREHLSGRRNWQYYLWDVLMFQCWLDESTKRP
ncbi:MAG: asparagine synthase (glutamine-hydrolyzing) [Burkholderiaceae bacterium]